MAKLATKMIDELEQLVIEKLRLELKRCDLWDKQSTNAELRSIHDRMRTLSRTTFEIWIELIPLLRRQLRIKRLRGSDRLFGVGPGEKELQLVIDSVLQISEAIAIATEWNCPNANAKAKQAKPLFVESDYL